VDGSKQRQVLEEIQIPRKINNLVCMTLQSTRARVKIQGQLTREFKVRRGLRQGDALSTTLFNLCLEHVMRQIPLHPGGTIYTRSLQYMAFADDDVLLGKNTGTLTEALQHMSEGLGHLGLRINTNKTKYIVNTRKKGRFQRMEDLEWEGNRYKTVVEFIYLRVLVSEDNEVNAGR
jgi:hypothetical protein